LPPVDILSLPPLARRKLDYQEIALSRPDPVQTITFRLQS
jgi:hypothetical protein